MPDHEILEYRPEFQEATVALYSEAFGLTLNEGRRYLDWKYQRNPYLSDPLIVVARSRRFSASAAALRARMSSWS